MAKTPVIKFYMMTGSCSIAKFWIIILMIFFSNFSLTKSTAIDHLLDSSFSFSDDEIEYFFESPLFGNKEGLSSGMRRLVEEISDDPSSSISGTREADVYIENTTQEYTNDYFMKISNFLHSLSCPKNLMNSLEFAILLSQNLANCTSDLSPEIILKIMLMMLFNDAYRHTNAGADKYLEIFSLASFSDQGCLDNVVALLKMNVLAMFKIPLSKRTFRKIFVPFIKTFSEKLPGGRLDLSMIWVLEIAAANESFDMNNSDKIFKLNHMMEFIETKVIPQFGIFVSGMLSQKSQITCTSFRIEYYLEIKNLAMVHSILSDGAIPISGGDLVYISELAISKKKCENIFKVLFENSDRNLDYSLLLSSNSILSLSEAKNVLQLYLPKITQIYLDPRLFVNCDNIWQTLIDVFYAKATMEEIMEYFLNHNMYYLLAKCFEYTVPEGLLADDLLSKFMEEDSKSFCMRLLRNILEFIDIKGCPRLKRLLANLIPDPEELNSLILEVISDYNFSKLTHDKFPILIQISGDLVYLFDLAVHLKDYSALSKICLCFRIEGDGEFITYKEYSQRSVHISDHLIHIFDDSGDIYDILI